MYPYRNNSYNMNSNSSNYQNYVYSNDGERFFWAPFVVGGKSKLVHIDGRVDMYTKLYKFEAKNE